jgi:plastocyanin
MASAVQQGLQDGRFDCETPAQQGMMPRKPLLRGAIIVALVGAIALISFYGGMNMATGCEAKNQDAANGKFVAAPLPGLRSPTPAVTDAASTPTMALAPGFQHPTATETAMEMENEPYPAPAGAWTHCSRRNALMKAAAAAAALAGVSPPAFAGATATVKMGSDSGQLVYVPDEVSICKGDQVTWVMNKAGPHNVVFEEVPAGVDAEKVGMESGEFLSDEGAKFSAKFDTPGQYSFLCEPHAGGGMKGTLTVKA